MAANSKFLSVGGWIKKVFQGMMGLSGAGLEWCGGETKIHAVGGIVSWFFPDFDIPNKIICWIVAVALIFLLLVTIPFVATGIGAAGLAVSSLWGMLARIVNIIKSPLELLYSLSRQGIQAFSRLFSEVGRIFLGTGETVAGITGVNPDLVRLAVVNLMAYLGLEMWHYGLVNRETWEKTPTYQIFHWINTPLSSLKGYLKEFLPFFLYPIASVFLMPVEMMEMLLATILGFVYYVVDKAEINSN